MYLPPPLKNTLHLKNISPTALYTLMLNSTNTFLLQKINNFNTDTLLITEIQTKGRGRYNRKWFSTPFQDLTFSLLIKSKHILEKAVETPSLLLYSSTIPTLLSIQKWLPNTYIKYPNDIITPINNKIGKIAGILVETKYIGNQLEGIVIGVGVNINSRKFIQYDKNIAVSLKYILHKNIPRSKFLLYWLKYLDSSLDKNILNLYETYKKHIYGIGKMVRVKVGEDFIEGRFEGISIEGKVVLNGSVIENVTEMIFLE